MAGSTETLERFESQTALPMLILAVISVPLLVAPLLFDLHEGVRSTIVALDWFIWAAFAVEYGIRLYLAPTKWSFIRGNVLDLLVVALPLLRPLRLARSARFLRLGQVARVTVMGARATEAAKDVVRKRRVNTTLLTAVIATIGAAFAVLELERASDDRNITSLPDALWWAITTVTTVGYGDRFPTTSGGRAIAAILMVVGIALFGMLAATISAIFVSKDVDNDLEPRLEQIDARLERIELALAPSISTEGERPLEREREDP
jgi:voltage-gated potassium channel